MPPVQPIIIRVIESPPTPELGFGAILLQALGLTGVTLLASFVLGLCLGVVFVWLRARRTAGSDDAGTQQVVLRLEAPARVPPYLHGADTR